MPLTNTQTMTNCYCGSEKGFEDCCDLYIKGIQKAPTAEVLMRSRYAAYATNQADYLINTTHSSQRKYYSKIEILNWAKANKWQKLEVIKATENTVEFKAYYLDSNNESQIHHEFSNFKFENGNWFYVDGEFY
ncbi:MAG: YchJ family metal-binding protein [Bacteroidota bacterium]